MEAKEVIQQFRKDLDSRENLGQITFHLDGLRLYLDAMEKETGISENAINRQHAALLADVDARNQNNLEMFRAVIEAGKTTLNSLMIVNGGAVVAMFGVMANLAGQKSGDGKALALNLALPMLLFGIGVVLAVVGFGFRYFSQDLYAYTNGKDRKLIAAHTFKALAVIAAISGYSIFLIAVFKSYKAVLLTFGA